MEVQEKNFTKLCSFYVSDWHLVTMLLPYINKKINEQAKIATILENDIQENVKTLVEKLNLKNAEKILNLNWKKVRTEKQNLHTVGKNQELIIIVNGNREFIKKQNERLEKYFSTHFINGAIKIINCYEVIELEGSINEILDEHDKILNTSGEKEINEIFEDYKKGEKIIPKEKVV